MANGYYTHATYPATNSAGSSAGMRAELDAVMAGFTLLPPPLGIGQQGFNGGSWSNPTITNGSINGTPIGAVSANTGKFSTLQSTGLATLGAGGTFTGTFTAAAAAILSAFAIQGGTIDNAAIGNTTPAAGTFSQLTVNGQANFKGPIVTTGGFASSGGSLELGSTSVSQIAFIDFHSSGLNTDYDARIASTGGDATIGDGTLNYLAKVHSFNTRPVFAGNVPWDKANLPSPMNAAGATMTGDLSVTAAGALSSNFYLASGAYKQAIRVNGGAGQMEWINNAYNAVNMWLTDTGNLGVRGGANFGTRPTWGGATPWDNLNFNPAAYMNKGGDVASGAQSVANGDPNAFQGSLGPGWLKLNENNYGAYIDFMSIRSQDYVWREHYNPGDATLQFIFNPANNGGVTRYIAMQPNSDIFCAGFGSVWANLNATVRQRNGNQGNGYVWANQNSIQIGWDGANYPLYTDNSFQGYILHSGTFQTWAAPRSVMDYGGVGSFTYMNTGSTPGANTLVNLPGLGGTWRVMSGGFGGAGHDVLYCRVG